MTTISYKNVREPIIPVGDLPMLALFARGEQGAWYDPSDMSTLFQDAAGTVPVTAVEQPVGRMLDKSPNGNHASQATTPARPTLSARVNKFPRTDTILWGNITGMTRNSTFQFHEETASWLAEHLETATTSPHNTNSDSGGKVQFLAGQRVTISVLAKSVGGRNFRIGGPSVATIDLGAIFDLSSGTVLSKSAGTEASIVSLGDGLFRCFVTAMTLATANIYIIFSSVNGTTVSFAGDVTKGFLLGAPDFRATDSEASGKPYQRVTSATDYDAVGFPHYLRFDGVDDFIARLIRPAGYLPSIIAATEYRKASGSAYLFDTRGGGSSYVLTPPNFLGAVGVGGTDATNSFSRAPTVSVWRLTTPATGIWMLARNGGTTEQFGGNLYGWVEVDGATDEQIATVRQALQERMTGVSA